MLCYLGVSGVAAYTALPLALSLRYRRKRAKKLSISVSNSYRVVLVDTVGFFGRFRCELAFFCSGSLTVSARLVRELRIWAAATFVEVFSKACRKVPLAMYSKTMRFATQCMMRGTASVL